MNAVVLLDRPRVGVARLLINRPDKRNAIDHAVREAMYERIGELGSDERKNEVGFHEESHWRRDGTF